MLYAAEGQHAQIIIVMCLRKTPHYVTSQSCKKSVLRVQHTFFFVLFVNLLRFWRSRCCHRRRY